MVRLAADRGAWRLVCPDHAGRFPDRGDLPEGGDHVFGLLYDDPDPDGRGARHPQPDQPEDHGAAFGLLLGGAEGGYHCPGLWRRERDRDLHHELVRHAV